MPCWAANKAIEISECSLSPLCAPELVKPAAILLRHFMSFHASLVESSQNCLKRALGAPLYVGEPKMMPSLDASTSQGMRPSDNRINCVCAFGTLRTPSATLWACFAVWP